jgi:hypothetical protein
MTRTIIDKQDTSKRRPNFNQMTSSMAGYRGRAAGSDNGYQIALQPPAAKSNRPVTANLENLSS